MIRTFDKDGDGYMTYDDFTNMVLSNLKKSLRCEALKRPHSRVGRFEPLSCEIEELLTTILQSEVDLSKRV